MAQMNRSGFTLIELLLGVTLSAILMTGIVVFVWSSMSSNMTTKTVLEERGRNEEFDHRITETLGNITWSWLYTTGASFGGDYFTGVVLLVGGSHPPITFFWMKSETWYCNSTDTVFKLSLRQVTAPSIQDDPSYILSSSENSVYSWSIRIIGTGYPGNTLTTSGIDTELSAPSALIASGTHIYIADTLNDRVLSYDITSKGISKLLGPENGISRPTSLSFSGNTLLIANSWNGKIYSLRDGEWDGTTFSIAFHIPYNFSADTLRFTFDGISSITWPTVNGSFTLTGVTQTLGDTVSTGTGLQYTLPGGVQTFISGTTYEFLIKNISPTPIAVGNHTVKIDFLSGSTNMYSDVFHYFTKWDGSIESNSGNIVEIIASGLPYPNSITGTGSWSGTIDWPNLFSGNPPGEEVESSLPIEDFNYSLSEKILSIRYHEYTHYDCSFWKHRTTEKILKILLP